MGNECVDKPIWMTACFWLIVISPICPIEPMGRPVSGSAMGSIVARTASAVRGVSVMVEKLRAIVRRFLSRRAWKGISAMDRRSRLAVFAPQTQQFDEMFDSLDHLIEASELVNGVDVMLSA